MLIFAYNPLHVGDTLLVIVADDKHMDQQVTRKKDVARIETEDGRVVGWNFFAISQKMPIVGNGQVMLSDEQLATLNDLLEQAGFAERLVADRKPKFVIGFVERCVAHPDSDHLSITQVDLKDEKLQIVCGAPNIRRGLKVVVAKPGAMMPDGSLIWPGSLRGVESFGMICSAKELQLANAPLKRGILELSPDAEVGADFWSYQENK